MKKLKFALWSLASFLLVTACSVNDDNGLNVVDNNNINKRDMVNTWDTYLLMTKLDRDAQKLLLNELTAEEKYAVWIHRFDDVIESNDLTIEQIAYIETLKSSIAPKTFVQDSDENIIFKTLTHLDLYGQGKNVFDEIVVYNITNTMRINVFTQHQDPEDGGGGSGQQSLCKCGINYTYTCPRVTGGGPGGGTVEYGKCEGSTCVKTANGCGFLMLYECNGAKCVFN